MKSATWDDEPKEKVVVFIGEWSSVTKALFNQFIVVFVFVGVASAQLPGMTPDYQRQRIRLHVLVDDVEDIDYVMSVASSVIFHQFEPTVTEQTVGVAFGALLKMNLQLMIAHWMSPAGYEVDIFFPEYVVLESPLGVGQGRSAVSRDSGQIELIDPFEGPPDIGTKEIGDWMNVEYNLSDTLTSGRATFQLGGLDIEGNYYAYRGGEEDSPWAGLGVGSAITGGISSWEWDWGTFTIGEMCVFQTDEDIELGWGVGFGLGLNF